MEQKQTIGQQALATAEKYFEIYKKFLSEPSLKDRAETLAKHDLLIEKIVNQFATRYLQDMIDEHKNSGENK